MKKLRLAKVGVRVAAAVLTLVILLAVAGPVFGFVTARFLPHDVVGFGVEVQAVDPQMQSILSDSATLTAEHTISVPVVNDWVFPASATLTVGLKSGGVVVYSTSGTISLQPFQAGELNVTFHLTQSVVNELAGKVVRGEGAITVGDPGYLWTFSLNLTRGA